MDGDGGRLGDSGSERVTATVYVVSQSLSIKHSYLCFSLLNNEGTMGCVHQKNMERNIQ